MNPNSEIRLSKNSDQEVMEFGQKVIKGLLLRWKRESV